MNIIEISVENKIAKTKGNPVIVCNNSGYVIKFAFDKEWDSEPLKTARFIYNGLYQDVVFDGDTCELPLIENTQTLSVGVFAGNLKTTTPAYIMCKYSILANGNKVDEPTPDVYAQIMELLNKYIEQGGGSGGISREEIEQIIADYLEQNPVQDGFSPIVNIEEIENGHRVSITDINGEKFFDVLNGKDGKDGASVDFSEYQKKVDNSLETESKEIVGAINEVNKKFGDINTALEGILGV